VVVDAMLVATVSVREDEVPAVVVVLIDAAVVVCTVVVDDASEPVVACTVVVDDASEPVVACTVVVDDASEPVLAAPRETSTDSTSAAMSRTGAATNRRDIVEPLFRPRRGSL
jgi:hypothetical protein